MSIKSIPISVKVFFLTLGVGITLFIILPKDSCGNVCGAGSIIPLLILSLMALIILSAFIMSIIYWLKKKVSTLTFIGIFIFFIFSIFVILVVSVTFSGGRCLAHWARTLSDMKQLNTAQELFYLDNNRYADTQEEIIDAGIVDNIRFKNWFTAKELTDKDGEGIEGGDNDSHTWSATTYISYKEIDKWCRVVNEGYWYTCNQNGCQKEETKNIQKSVACTEEAKICPDGSAVGRTGPNCEFAECPTVNIDETADWQTTEVIKYISTEIPSEIKEGHCWVNSISAPRKGAWRCMIESSISDPCFVINGSEDLVCDFDPITGDKGFLLKLTEPLPEDTATDYYGQGWGWLIQLEDGITCRFITGATGGINNERINYYCSDDSFVIGDLEVGTIWKAKKVDNPQTKSIEVVSIKKVWQ